MGQKGIHTVRDLIFHFPIRYEDRRTIHDPADLVFLPEGQFVCVEAEISRLQLVPLRGRRGRMAKLLAKGKTGTKLECSWFHTYKGMERRFPSGKRAIFSGNLRLFRGQPQLSHPEVELIDTIGADDADGFGDNFGKVMPIYSLTQGIGQKWLRALSSRILAEFGGQIVDILPESVRRQHKLPDAKTAVFELHHPEQPLVLAPESSEHLAEPVRRLIFEEFFLFQMALMLDRPQTEAKAVPVATSEAVLQKYAAKLPFTLTAAQKRVLHEVLGDLQKPHAMNRIVQGDVGCGKTVVALLAAAQVAEQDRQTAIMAPTEVLAEQHYREALKVFPAEQTGYLSGSLTKIEKEKAYQRIATGQWKVVVGTHALIQKAVQWHRLSLVIVDEQHRFGVRQRAYLRSAAAENETAHLLTMTATPIPRSLALTAFGELDVSTIDELPPGRQKILTKVLGSAERHRLHKLIRREVADGRQAYIVYPLVEDSDKGGMDQLKSVVAEFDKLASGPLAGLRMRYMHGKMPYQERAAIMQAFKRGDFDVLLSTTVIEVGVDVPNAVVMGVENAERFGLSQLHQLRGRVGRGSAKSYCVLCTDVPRPAADAALEDSVTWQRLQIMEQTQDGFVIAEADLKLRGPGEFLGTKQSGSPNFRLADLTRDQKLLEAAKAAAETVLAKDTKLELPGNTGLRKHFDVLFQSYQDELKSG